jgi:hypothetical protein
LKKHLKKHFSTFLFLLMVPTVYCQSAPLVRIVSSQNWVGNRCLLTIKATVSKGWYVHAKDEAANQVKVFDISSNIFPVVKSPDFKKADSPEFNNIQTMYNKILDEKPIRVYNNSFQFIQAIQFDGAIPPILKITIHGFAANRNEFEYTMVVQLRG